MHNTAAVLADMAGEDGGRQDNTARGGLILRNRRIWVWAAAFLVGTLLLCCGGWWWLGKEFKGMDDAPHMTKAQIAAFEASYQGKGTAEQAVQNLETVIARAADRIAALVPGLTWQWHRDISPAGCPQDPHGDTWVMRMYTRFALFSGPIPEEAWRQALAIVRDVAASLGMGDQVKFHDQQENHDLVLYAPDGGEISFGSAKAALLSGTTACRLREHWYAERNLPVPGQK